MKKNLKHLFLALVAALGIMTYVQYETTNASSVKNVVSKTKIPSAKSFKPNYELNSNENYIDNLISDNNTFKGTKKAKASVALDVDKNTFVYDKNGNKNMRIASVAKLMTLYLVIQKAQNTNDGWNQVVNTSSASLRRMGQSAAVGGFKFKKGYNYTVKQLYQAALIQSSNNATIALGEWVAGSNKAFINMMNNQSKAWNLNATFVSASGLENHDLSPYGYWVKGKYREGNMVSARAVAIIASHVLKEYPRIVDDASKTKATVAGQTIRNVNRMLPGQTYYKKSLYVDGLKTGYTPDAGLCFVATGQKPGKDRLVTVVLNDNDEFSETKSLMKHIYSVSDLFK
ncbi:D-alanyl-D-alanine carboxypeptidase family protein [Apilactobacillus xinyiensis]|uniref:D-alanyl-D-alanine carboxypeptidase family protein n=1 Tax=Apilactobacillus xinyiensis TaxID=2841032 RepID=UPI001C7CE0C9|nr:serine hydrolase [Apilactobacillus xinyiensis]MCL0312005.1 serine hydrolase [Apilactobacillus xinyiensis]MCL0318721.1 serine hydrolase [Apilactobacillus xinyiensis]MCL0329597.1 serine hydrolase [Apilactobacillus xinyiensis]